MNIKNRFLWKISIALTVPAVPTALTAPIAPIAITATTASKPPRGSILLIRILKEQLRKGVQSVQFSQFSQFKSLSQVIQPKSSSRSLFIRSFEWIYWFDLIKVGSDQLLQHKGNISLNQYNPHIQRLY